MANYEITAPDGKTYEITAPEGTSQEDALAYFQQQYQAGKSQPEAEEESPALTDRINAIGQGASFGFADEIGSGLAAGAVKVFGDTDEDFADIYRSMMDSEAAKRKSYEKENPIESTLLNVAGGVTTGGVGLTKALGANAVKNAGKLGKTLATLGVGATEGGLAGAGAADSENILEGTAKGAGMGLILPAVLGSGKGALNVLGKRRIAKDLVDDAGDFLPMNLAADENTMLQSFFQKGVGPSFGGQKLRDQNQAILEKAVAASKKATDLVGTAKESGKKLLDKSLRKEAIKISIPSGVSDEVRTAINKADGQDAIKALNEAWKDGFKMVNDKTFKLNPKEMLDDIVDDLDSPVDADFVSNIRGILTKKLGQGFKPDTGPPLTKFSKIGVRTQKNPDVKLDTGSMGGEHLIEARNALKRQANKLGDEGSAALEKSALRKAADKIDDQIRAGLSEVDATKFNDELSAYGKYQVARGAVKKAISGKQGEWTIEDYLTSGSQRQGRSAEMGEAVLQKKGQQLQTQGKEAIEALSDKANKSKEDLVNTIHKATPLNPALWSKAFTTGAMGAPAAAVGKPEMALPLGLGLGKILATQKGQRIVAGQTGKQQALAEMLRKYDASMKPEILQRLQGAGSRTLINEMVGE